MNENKSVDTGQHNQIANEEGAPVEQATEVSQPQLIQIQAPTPVNGGQPAAPSIENSYAKSLRSISLKTLLGTTIAVAVVTVILILIGSWSDATWRAIWTMVIAVIHLLIVLGLASSTMHAKDERSMRSSNAVLNTSLVVTIVSFFVTTMTIWNIMAGDDLWRWYLSFVVIIFAALHIKAFYDMDEVPSTRQLVLWYYGVIIATAVLVMGWIIIHAFGDIFGGFLVRLVAATIVANVTMGIVIAVMRRLYYQQHPEVRAAQTQQSSTSLVIIIVLAVCLFFYGGPFLISMLWR